MSQKLPHQKGIIHLGVLAILFLAGAALVGTKVVSDLGINFNIAELAKPPEGKEACQAAGCPWVWRNGACKKTEDKCGSNKKKDKNTKSQNNESTDSCGSGGTCRSLKNCYDEPGLKNISGSCGKDQICCGGSPKESNGGGGSGNSGGAEEPQYVNFGNQGRNLDIDLSPNFDISGPESSCTVGEVQTFECTTSQGCKGTQSMTCKTSGWGALSSCSPKEDCTPNKPNIIKVDNTTTPTKNCPSGVTFCRSGDRHVWRCNFDTGIESRGTICPTGKSCNASGALALCQ